MELTQQQIENINNKCPYNHGIFVQPYGIPVTYKEPVIYMRYETGGWSGGSCWDDSDPQPYSVDEVPTFEALDLVLQELMPNITYLQFKKIDSLIHTNEDTEAEYYGNSTDYMIKFIVLSDLIEFLESISPAKQHT